MPNLAEHGNLDSAAASGSAQCSPTIAATLILVAGGTVNAATETSNL